MADSILTNLVQVLGGLAYEEYKVVKGVGDQLKSLECELRFMKKFLRNSEGKQQEHELVKELVEQIKEVAFEAEDVIETFLLNVEKQKQRTSFGRVVHGPEYALMLREVADRINGIKMRVNEIYDNKEKYGIEIGEGNMNPHFQAALERRRKEVDEEMVGFKDVADTLLKQLTEGSTGLEIVSIVGMGGLGKTTIAKSLYNDRIINDHFKSHAWVTVSEDYNTRQVILDVLNRVAPNLEDVEKMETDKLKEMLRDRLMGKKYIVFLDDVWQPDMWDEVKTCFPDKANGSRIVVTTRITNVGRHASKKEPHFLRFFTFPESWELFEKKVFGEDHPCPLHLKSLGTKIVEGCKGLPLSIAVIASMLGSQEKSEIIWERTLKDVSAHLGKDEACLEILALSYHNLPVELKPCFLYFAAFPEDHKVSVRNLISLWLAEGFIQLLGELTLEEVAESYLDALVDRSLVQAGKRRTDGGLKTCGIHDLIRDLCIREARCENFMSAAPQLNNPSSSTIIKSKPRRLSIHHHTSRTVLSKDWDPSSVRAILSFDSRCLLASSAFLKKLHADYKLLRVLDLETSIRIETLPDNFDSLVNLRYLRLFIAAYYIPESIFGLRNLQMLFVSGTSSTNIPIGALLKMQNLQQLVTRICRLYGNCSSMLPKKQLKRLRVLSCIFPDYDFENAVMNGLCMNLRKLSLFSSQDHCWSLNNYLVYLPALQSLKISSSFDSCGRNNIFSGVTEDNLPSTLTKITLNSLYWISDHSDMLGKFPNLRILKLIDVKFSDQIVLKRGSFPRLHTLHMDNVFDRWGRVLLDSPWVDVYTSNWIWYKDDWKLPPKEDIPASSLVDLALPQLRRLFLKKCTIFIDELFFILPTLKDAEVMWPTAMLSNTLERLKAENKIKCRLLVYKGE